MALVFETKEYSPSELAKVLSEEYGHKVTPSVIRKWDNEIFSGISSRKRDKSEARNYTNDDLLVFNAIAVLRNMGHSLEDVKGILRQISAYAQGREDTSAKPDFVINMGGQRIIIEIKGKIEKQEKGFKLFEEFLTRLKKE
jgi:DNA-binding transcriptional MerR regulator